MHGLHEDGVHDVHDNSKAAVIDGVPVSYCSFQSVFFNFHSLPFWSMGKESRKGNTDKQCMTLVLQQDQEGFRCSQVGWMGARAITSGWQRTKQLHVCVRGSRRSRFGRCVVVDVKDHENFHALSNYFWGPFERLRTLQIPIKFKLNIQSMFPSKRDSFAQEFLTNRMRDA